MYTEGCEHGIGAAGFPRAALDTAFVSRSTPKMYMSLKAKAMVTATWAFTNFDSVNAYTHIVLNCPDCW